jgi:hypothetical protein
MRLGDIAIALPDSSPPGALHKVGLFLPHRSAAAPVRIPYPPAPYYLAEGVGFAR